MENNSDRLTNYMLKKLDSFDEGYLQLDKSGKIVITNMVLAQMCGYGSTEDMIGKYLSSVFTNTHDYDYVTNAVHKNGKINNYKVELLVKNASPFWALCNFNILWDKDGRDIGVEVVVRDITKFHSEEETQKELNRQLKVSNQQLKATEQQLRSANQQLEANNQQLIASDQEMKKQAHFLQERLKELSCFYEISELVRTNITIEELLQEIVNIIPSKWQYPEIARGKIKFEGNEYVSQTFMESKWKHSSDIILKGKVLGSVEVYYLQELPGIIEDPFLNEERKLIEGIAKNISETIERNRAEEALQNSEEKFQDLFFSIALPLCLVDNDGIIKLRNNKFVEVFGYTEEEVPSLKEWWIRAYPNEEYREWVIRNWESAVKNAIETGKDIKSDEYLVTCKDGSNRNIIISGSTIDDNFVATFIDITERKRAESDLLNKNDYIESIMDNMPIGFGVNKIDDGAVKYLNKQFENIYGWSKEVLTNTAVFFEKVFPDAEYREEIKNQIISDMESGDPDRMVWDNLRIVTNKGEERIVKAYNIPLPNQNIMISTVQDVTESKISEILLKESNKRIEESEKKFKTLFYDNSLAQLLIDPTSGDIVDVNQAASIFYGYSYEELTALTIHDINLSSQEVVKAEMKDAREKKRNYFEFRHKLHDGTSRYVEVYSNPILVDNKEYLISNIHDVTARKIAERKRAESESKYKLITENVTDVVWLLNLEKKCFTYLSPSIFQLRGFTPEEAMKLSLEDSMDPESFHEINAKIALRLQEFTNNPQTSKIYLDEIRQAKKDGTFIWVETSTKFQFNHDEEIEILGISRDITERKITEEKLIESEEMLRSIFDNSTSVIYSHDINSIVNYVSPRIEDVLGYTQEEAKINWTNLLSDNPLNELAIQNTKKSIEKAEKQGAYEVEFLHKNGKRIIVEAREAPVVRNGKTVSIVGIFNDISERKHIEDELSRITKRLQIATESANIGIWELDLKKNVLVWDKQMFSLYGIKPEDFGGAYEAWKAGVHPDDKNRSDNEVQDAIAGNKDFHTQFRVIWPNGQIHFIEAHALIIKDSDGLPESMIGVNWMITDRIETEQELITAKLKAEESDRLKSAFLANMSHEIRTPMNGILGFTELLKEHNLSGEKRDRFIEIIRKSGDRMLNTVNDIIDISKIDAGQEEISRSDVNLNEVLNNQVEFFDKEAAAKGIELKLINNLPQKSIIFSDEVKLNSIITNLIKNAIKYTNEGSIELICNKKDSKIEFVLTDTGIGIPTNRIESVFNRFEQADIKDAQARQGSGLGLSIAKAYVEMLGGNIGVKSKLGDGSTFYFTLPWSEKHNNIEKISKKEDVAERTNVSQINIMIAEDDDISFEHLKIILNKIAKSISRTVNGKQAIDFVTNNTDVDLVLMDVKMPVMDGLEATKEIRKINKDVIIIAQTANALIGDMEKALAVGCNDYIAKPIDSELLLEIINKYLK